MLTGRESLCRLVGRRRHFLPHRHSILSSALPIQSCSSLSSSANGKSVQLCNGTGLSETKVKVELDEEKDELASKSDWVTCPVCGSRVRGNDFMINSHLDTCLTRGTKRKLSQRTLLQLNFSPRPKFEAFSAEPEASISNADAGRTDFDGVCISSVDDENQHELALNVPHHTLKSNDKVDLPSLCPLGAPYTGMNTGMISEDIFGSILETYIVGRKFSDEKGLEFEMKVSLHREPDNAKDPNAVKVTAYSEPSKLLGYLPRGLAQYVSPLMEKCCSSFEGRITVVPEHYPDVVPIQLSCAQIVPHCENNSDLVEDIKYLLREALREADAAKKNPPSLTKYQQNFRVLIHEVMTTCPHLFTEDEKMFFDSFTSLSDDSQRLFVRLYTRKGPWFRMSKISYPEISDTKQAIDGLSGARFIVLSDSSEVDNSDMKAILGKLTVAELREILCSLKKNENCNRRKEELISSLLSSYEDGSCSCLPSMIFDKAGLFAKTSTKAESLFWRAERLFFLNAEQDLSAFLLVDLGVVKYPIYNCIVSNQIFSTRTELLAYEEAIEVAQLMDQSLDENDTDKVLQYIKIADSRLVLPSSNGNQSETSLSSTAFISCFTALWIYSKVVLLGVSFLELERRYSDAVTLLRKLLNCFSSDGRRGYWTVRLSIDLEHMGYLNESLSVAENGILDSWVRAGSKIALQKRILRLAKPPRRWKIPTFPEYTKRKIREVQVIGRPLNCELGKKSRFYGEDGEQCGVEQLALQYYASNEGGEWHGVHSESGIWLTIFGLLMWDVIFSDVPDVFRTQFQTAPLDLGTDTFYPIRKPLIESLLQRIQHGEAEEILIQSWESHNGRACRGVNWDRHSLPELRAAVSCIGGPCLASLCRHLSQDYRSWSSGMPDLLLWRFCGGYRGEARLVEVKGPNDRLSEQQRAWILILMEMGFDAELCKVGPGPI